MRWCGAFEAFMLTGQDLRLSSEHRVTYCVVAAVGGSVS